MSLHCESVSLKRMLEESIEEHRSAGDLAGIGIRMTGGDGLKIHVDRQIFWRILSNLLWNALQHAPQGSEIEVGYNAVADDMVNIYIANRGTPIPEHERDLLFHSFVSHHRGWRTRPIDSTGLGLTFCKLAVEAHGGSIQLESPWEKHGDGVRISISLHL